ncbi:MAG: EF-P lysine aminoacylase EpmA [Smithellaceae bacterium]|nr:EF-P lysine aminoacylase EpmA [Smithellaceae bacterium]
MSRTGQPVDKKSALRIRARLIQAVRSFFSLQGYLEVETPLRIPAPLPEVHIDAIPSGDWFLQTSPEVCMKRLLGAGYDRIFQIAKCFRAGERGSLHLPEFTMLEWYRLDADYTRLMEECEDLVLFIADELDYGEAIPWRGGTISLAKPWTRLSLREAFLRYAAISVEEAMARDLFEETLVSSLEPHLGREKPAILYDYPLALGALAKAKGDDPSLVERFELYLGGLEIANAFSELTDVEEQRRRFDRENHYRKLQGKKVYPPAEPFLQSLGRIKSAAGIALGIDRLVMLFADVETIDQVVAFTPEEL